MDLKHGQCSSLQQLRQKFYLEQCRKVMQEGYGGCDNVSNQSFQNLTFLVEHQMVL